MKQDKNLILFTNYYPFYKGEEYIENEISFAASYYKKILIIPTMVSDKMKQTRKVPSNTEILNLKIDCSKKGKITMVIKKFSKVLNKKKWKDSYWNEKKLLPSKLIYKIYYLCRVEDVCEKIINSEQFNNFINGDTEIVLYSYWMHAVASIAARIKERVFNNQVLCITRGHRYDLYEYAAPCGYIPDREYVFEKMDAIYPCSQDGVDYLKIRYPKFKDKIEVQRLGTMPQKPIVCKREPVFTMVSCSGVRKVKRLDKIINVVDLLLKDKIKVKWIHLGDGPELENIMKLAKKKLPSEAYQFVGGLQNREVYKWYRNNTVSCFVNLSDSEGVPVAIMEAMSFGIPIVATDVGGTREIVENSKNGYVFSKEVNDKYIEEIVKKIYFMESERYNELCTNSFDSWNRKSNAQVLYKDFYNKMTS